MPKIHLSLLFLLTFILAFGYCFIYAFAKSPAYISADLDEVSIYVRDGDTFVIDGQPIRLAYVDAPERGQPFYSESKALLVQMLENGDRIDCVKTGMSYGRVVAQCNVDKEDIGYRLAREGLAFRDPRYSTVKRARLLVYAQTLARVSGRGAWSEGQVIYPWDKRNSDR